MILLYVIVASHICAGVNVNHLVNVDHLIKESRVGTVFGAKEGTTVGLVQEPPDGNNKDCVPWRGIRPWATDLGGNFEAVRMAARIEQRGRVVTDVVFAGRRRRRSASGGAGGVTPPLGGSDGATGNDGNEFCYPAGAASGGAITEAVEPGLLMVGDSVTRNLFGFMECTVLGLDEHHCALKRKELKGAGCAATGEATGGQSCSALGGKLRYEQGADMNWFTRHNVHQLISGARAKYVYIGLPALHSLWSPGQREKFQSHDAAEFQRGDTLQGRLKSLLTLLGQSLRANQTGEW